MRNTPLPPVIADPNASNSYPHRSVKWGNLTRPRVREFEVAIGASCTVADRTQIYTHMCYAEFNDIMPSIAAMDADVISIETSRSQMELLGAFVDFHYPNEIGPGVYDIHSPRVPAVEEIAALLKKARQVLAPDQLWVNPDCGLKTRGWPEVTRALTNMVAAAQLARRELAEEFASASHHPMP